MSEGPVSVYCDGSLTNSILSDVFTSTIGAKYVGRAIVLVPKLDLGLSTQTRSGMTTARGTPSSNNAEVFAIHTALELCRERCDGDFVVYSDCQGAVERFRDEPVEWRTRRQLRLPNDFFDKVLGRASYLRSSTGTVSNRRPVQAHQLEAFELFNSPRREFRLSESALWTRVNRDADRHPDASR